jgi:hypothetical protein
VLLSFRCSRAVNEIGNFWLAVTLRWIFVTVLRILVDTFPREDALFGLTLFSPWQPPERNPKTDERRLSQIWKVVSSAMADAEAERKGLRVRIEKARRSAGFLLEIDFGECDPSNQTELKTIERYIRAAESRHAELKDHLDHLGRIKAATAPLPH